MDILTVEAVVSDLHPCAESANSGKVFDREANGLRGRGEATIAKLLPRTALALSHEQFCRQAVVKRHTRLQQQAGSNRLRARAAALLGGPAEKIPRQTDPGEEDGPSNKG